MAVRIRMKRLGRRKRPFYRLVAIDSKVRREGVEVERLGWYDPLNKDIINSEILNTVSLNGLNITVYSENNITLGEAIELWSAGVKSIFIDDPSEFKFI